VEGNDRFVKDQDEHADPPFGCSHNPMSQKGCWTTKKNSENWINIYIFPFKAMEIMASYLILIHMNVKEFKPKIHLMKFKFKF
jgi:hypothetical protein